MAYARGPEFDESGDPTWIEPEIQVGGALEGDSYTGWGRWRARIYPPSAHISDSNPLTIGRVGLWTAVNRVSQVLNSLATSLPDEEAMKPSESPTLQAVVAVADALEWVHSLHDHLTYKGEYRRPSELDAELGPYIEGLIGARNASHHGLRRVVGFVTVPMSVYAVKGRRWVHTGTYAETAPSLQLRWIQSLPPRSERRERGKPALRYADQIDAFERNLAGRDVRNTFNASIAFFFSAIAQQTWSPDTLYGPAAAPPPIDPAVLRRSDDGTSSACSEPD